MGRMCLLPNVVAQAFVWDRFSEDPLTGDERLVGWQISTQFWGKSRC